MVFNETINTGTTPGDGKGAGLRTNMRKLIENDNYLKGELESTQKNINKNNLVQVTPEDAVYVSSNYEPGALKIMLPDVNNSTIFNISMDLFFINAAINKSFSAKIFGTYYNSSWSNTSVQIITSLTDLNLPVRFAFSNGKHYIYIGELNTYWHFVTAVVSKFVIKYNNVIPNEFLTGWQMSLETTAFENVTQTHTNNLPVAQ